MTAVFSVGTITTTTARLLRVPGLISTNATTSTIVSTAAATDADTTVTSECFVSLLFTPTTDHPTF
eukprot:7611679-Pyramimonas_sp.AAC.1